MLAEGSQLYRVAWWMVVVPAGAVLALTLALNVLGDALRDAFDARRVDTAVQGVAVIVRFLLRRIVSGLLTLFVISLLMFILFYVAPNDPARTIAGPQATCEVVEQIQQRLGLDRPLPTRFGQFLGDLLHGDLGYSYYNQRPVLDTILDRLPVTASVAIGAAVLWTITGIPHRRDLGAPPGELARPVGDDVRARRAQLPDVRRRPAAALLPVLPAHVARHRVVPGRRLRAAHRGPVAVGPPSHPARGSPSPSPPRRPTPGSTRGQMLEVFGEDYIRTARAKGLSERRVVYRHGLRSAVTPLFTQFGLDVALLLGGLVVTEQIFGLPGHRAPRRRVGDPRRPADHHRHVLFASAFVVVANIVVDVGYALLDARVRHQLTGRATPSTDAVPADHGAGPLAGGGEADASRSRRRSSRRGSPPARRRRRPAGRGAASAASAA